MQTNSKIHIIAALGEKNKVIGKNGKIPWYIPADLKRFKKLTTGSPVIMGRKTFESIGKALPSRINIVITSKNKVFPNCITAHSLEEAIVFATEPPGGKDVFIIGGGQIYKEALEHADILHLTLVKGDFEGDAFFPDYSDFKKEVFREEHLDNEPGFVYLDLIKF